MGLLELFGAKRGRPSSLSEREFKAVESVFPQLYKRIEDAGGIDLLIGMARDLREKGDPTGMVAENRFCIRGYAIGVMVELRFEREKRAYLTSSTWWKSKGIAIEASGRSKDKPLVHVRFTDGNSWNCFEHDQTPNGLVRFQQITRGVSPTEEEQAILDSGGEKGSLEARLKLAQKIARRQFDYSYGESETPQPRVDNKFRLIF